MVGRPFTLGATFALGSTLASVAFAQGTPQMTQTQPMTPSERRAFVEQRVLAPTSAFEITAGTGYTQGFGRIQQGLGVQDIAQGGVGVDLGLGYRISPGWSVGVGGEYYRLNAQRGDGTRGMTAGANATWHIRPYTRLDPFLQVGFGYRALWESFPGRPTTLYQGWELARATIGADLRATEDVALGPMVGADLNLLFWQNQGGGNVMAPNPRLNTFVFAGVQGRFDLGGSRVSGAEINVARR